MAKTKIRGTFATGADAASVHQISTTRRNWLDRETVKAVDEAVVFFVPISGRIGPKKSSARDPKRAAAGRSPRVAVLSAKKK